MANRIRGEYEASFGGKTFVLALTMRVLAELEDAFDVDWDQIDPMLWRHETIEIEGEKRVTHVPRVRHLLKFWRTVFDVHKIDVSAFDAPSVSPFDLLRQALELIAASRDAWFGNDRERDESDTPLRGALVGGPGSA